ncbi:hypothetical protein [Nostoc sp.]
MPALLIWVKAVRRKLWDGGAIAITFLFLIVGSALRKFLIISA